MGISTPVHDVKVVDVGNDEAGGSDGCVVGAAAAVRSGLAADDCRGGTDGGLEAHAPTMTATAMATTGCVLIPDWTARLDGR